MRSRRAILLSLFVLSGCLSLAANRARLEAARKIAAGLTNASTITNTIAIQKEEGLL